MYHLVNGSIVPISISIGIGPGDISPRTRSRHPPSVAIIASPTTARPFAGCIVTTQRETFLLRAPPRLVDAADVASRSRSRLRRPSLVATRTRRIVAPPGLASLASTPRPRGKAVRLCRSSAVNDVMASVRRLVVVVWDVGAGGAPAGTMDVARSLLCLLLLLRWRWRCSALDHWGLLFLVLLV